VWHRDPADVGNDFHETELDASMASVRRHLEDPHTLEIFALYFQAWGRKPEH
jgi:hypothetical protein